MKSEYKIGDIIRRNRLNGSYDYVEIIKINTRIGASDFRVRNLDGTFTSHIHICEMEELTFNMILSAIIELSEI